MTSNKILIALDYNPTAQKVAEKGYTLGKAMGAEVYLLHVMSEPFYYSSTAYSPIMGFVGFTELDTTGDNLSKSLERSSQAFLDQTKNHLYDQDIQTLIKSGDPADAILASAGDLSVEFIVVGSHSRRWLEKVLLGSVTEKIMRHTEIPVFIIPTKNTSS